MLQIEPLWVLTVITHACARLDAPIVRNCKIIGRGSTCRKAGDGVSLLSPHLSRIVGPPASPPRQSGRRGASPRAAPSSPGARSPAASASIKGADVRCIGSVVLQREFSLLLSSRTSVHRGGSPCDNVTLPTGQHLSLYWTSGLKLMRCACTDHQAWGGPTKITSGCQGGAALSPGCTP